MTIALRLRINAVVNFVPLHHRVNNLPVGVRVLQPKLRFLDVERNLVLGVEAQAAASRLSFVQSSPAVEDSRAENCAALLLAVADVAEGASEESSGRG
jgi:hypothetical protein